MVSVEQSSKDNQQIATLLRPTVLATYQKWRKKGLKLDLDKNGSKKVLGFGSKLVRKGNNKQFRL